jgi:hypothetical protein
MSTQCVLIASADMALTRRLKDNLGKTYDLESAQSCLEALTKLRREWYLWILFDPALVGPGGAKWHDAYRRASTWCPSSRKISPELTTSSIPRRLAG